MPELPEVETIVRGLRRRLVGLRFERVKLTEPRVVVGDVGRVAGYTVGGLRRWGKHIVIELRRGRARAHLLVHLGMTGQLLWDARDGPHTHARFWMQGGRRLLYNDPRQFGRLEFAESLPARLARLGPDPLELPQDEFVRRLRSRRAMAKALLLNQEFLRGLGNIYADESLFRAGIHPRAIGARLRPQRAAGLWRAILAVLREAIASGGSSVSDYLSSDGIPGKFQIQHRVYGRAGEPCLVCGTAIRRILVASRGTHFCPRCQRI